MTVSLINIEFDGNKDTAGMVEIVVVNTGVCNIVEVD